MRVKDHTNIQTIISEENRSRSPRLLSAQLKASTRKSSKKSAKMEKHKSLHNLTNGIKTLAKSGGSKKSKSHSRMSCVPAATGVNIKKMNMTRNSNQKLSPRQLEYTLNNSSIESFHVNNSHIHVVEVDQYPIRHDREIYPENEIIHQKLPIEPRRLQTLKYEDQDMLIT